MSWVEEAWTDIDVQLKRKVDLVPPFIDTIQPYARQEQYALEKLVEVRSRLTSNHANRTDLMIANEEMNGALKQVFDYAQDNTELQEEQEFHSLKNQFQETETKIKKALRIYDNTVTKYNTKIQSPPTSFVANIHGFYKRKPIGEAVPQEASR